MNFIGPAKRLEDIDLPRVGAMIGVGEDEIHAFIDVETSGGGFDKLGRPKALYEPHVAYRCSAGEKRAQLVKAGLAYPKWGEKPYPADSYARINAACAIDETAALKGTSWGLGQVLGENHVAAGYDTVQAMVADFLLDEDNHLEAAIRFIKANHLDDELRGHNWAAFARGYNGPGYAKNSYDTKLAVAYAKWARIKDTPYLTGVAEIARPPAIVVSQTASAQAPAALPVKPEPPPAPSPAPAIDKPRNDGAVTAPPSESLWRRFLSAFGKRLST